MNKEEINFLADKLYIKLKDEELEFLYNEFDYIKESMELIENIEGIKEYPPMHMVPFTDLLVLRKDEVEESLTTGDVLKNCDDVLEDCVKVPKVVK